MAGREAESTVRIKRESRSKFVSETELSISNRYRPRAPSVLTLAGLLFVDELKDADETFHAITETRQPGRDGARRSRCN